MCDYINIYVYRLLKTIVEELNLFNRKLDKLMFILTSELMSGTDD